MSDVTLNDMYTRLECMKQIIIGDQSTDIENKTKGNKKGDPLCLVDADGMVNNQAKEQLLEHVHKTIESLHELLAKPMQQQKQSRGWSLGGVFSPSQKKVQLLLSRNVRTSKNFHPALTTFFKEFQFKFDIVGDMANLKETLPLFVVCPLSTRMEPDIDHVISGLDWQSKYAVLIVHSGLESSLPQMTTSSKLHGHAKYSNIEFIDVAFSEEKKFYSTDMNKKARKLIQEFAEKA